MLFKVVLLNKRCVRQVSCITVPVFSSSMTVYLNINSAKFFYLVVKKNHGCTLLPSSSRDLCKHNIFI